MIDYSQIPESTRYALDAWAERAQLPGGFVAAVLRNDLFDAIGRADESNIAAIHSIVAYVYNEMPAACWGSREKCAAWMRAHPIERETDDAIDEGNL